MIGNKRADKGIDKEANKGVVISLGGSLIVPDEIDIDFLRKFKELIEGYVKKGYGFAIITGGGKTARRYQKALSELNKDATDEQKDLVGIETTKLNALLVKNIFDKGLVHNEIVDDFSKEIKTNKKIIICSGWKPGCSTDCDSVYTAEMIKARTIINMSNVRHVYTADPKYDKNAKKLESISWKDYRKIIGDKWIPGMNTPFDPIASERAEKGKLKVVIIGNDFDNLNKVLNGEKFEGTLIS